MGGVNQNSTKNYITVVVSIYEKNTFNHRKVATKGILTDTGRVEGP